MLLPLLGWRLGHRERWRKATPALVGLFLLPVPFNLTHFDQGTYGERWMANRQYVLTTAVRMPFASDVPRDVRPMSSAIVVDPVTIGFLLDAAEAGKLTPSTTPLTPAVVNEFRVRLGVAHRLEPGPPLHCPSYDHPITLDTRRGDVLHLGSAVRVAIVDDGQRASRSVVFPASTAQDVQLTIELPNLSLWIGPTANDKSFSLCQET